jgi:2-dehydro-3-deoxy-D-pentonate aldolase
MSATVQPAYSGIIVPMVTPLASTDKLDEVALERLVTHLLAGGVHGLFLLGTCGEGPSLSYRIRQELINRVCQQVAGRIPILVNITDTAGSETDLMARHAANAGADAVVIAPPFYLPLEQFELREYITCRVRQSPLPVMLYNMPALTKLEFEPLTVKRLADDPRIVGLKDSSGDLSYFESIRRHTRERADWSLLVGSEQLLVPSLQIGGNGGVCGGANIFPQLFVQIYDAAAAGETDSLGALVSKAGELGEIYDVGCRSAGCVVKALKTALKVIGIGEGLPAEPLRPLTTEEHAHIHKIVQTLGLELVSDVRGMTATKV